MTTEIDGQTDVFDMLDDTPPQPVFTVYEMTAALGWPNLCGWGCGKGGYLGGGATRWREDKEIGISYSYCQSCTDKYGHPRVSCCFEKPTPLRLVRFQEYAK